MMNKRAIESPMKSEPMNETDPYRVVETEVLERLYGTPSPASIR